MLYICSKWLVRFGLKIFFRKIVFQPEIWLRAKGPLLLACNHPNSFLDALILGSYFNQPVHFLARGDAFKNPLAKKLLTALKVIPIYRLSEGKEYLALNDATFQTCAQILLDGGIVLIFSEGLCLHEWNLRPLKKGTARIALSTWKHLTVTNSFRILPVAFNYSSFKSFRKNVIIDFDAPIKKNDLPTGRSEGEQITSLNSLITERLKNGLVTEDTAVNTVEALLSNADTCETTKHQLIPAIKTLQKILKNRYETDFSKLVGTRRVALKRFDRFISFLLIPVLFIPALTGLLIHLPLYLPLNNTIKKKTKDTVFYHSALFGALVITYPVYVIIISVTFALVFHSQAFLLCVLLMPVAAKIFLLWKDCLESIINYYKLPKIARRVLSRQVHKTQSGLEN